ncbi:MAG TPA: HEAT repeat domain-containing protein [Polyangia bacterium]|nr:HEAT repeat domain-containing protein [Polyangia bacterium]
MVCVAALLATDARADRVDDLTRALITDPSWRVRLQAAVVLGKLHDRRAAPALERALRDPNESVRGLAAQLLGDLGTEDYAPALERARMDSSAFVRDRAEQSLLKLRPQAAATRDAPPGSLHVEVGGIGAKGRNVSPELTRRLREFILRELARTPGLTIEGKPLSGFLIDSAITSVSRKNTDNWVEISCEVSLIVGRLPSKSMVMMTSGGATVQTPKMGFRPEKEQALQVDALEGAVHGAHENLLAFLRSQQPR